MADTNKIDELVDQIKTLIATLEKPKKDWSGWFTLLTSFLGTVVIAGLSLYYSNLESERSFQYNLMQVEIQKANLRVEELKALNDLVPSIASKDANVRAVAFRLLEAANRKSTDSLPVAARADRQFFKNARPQQPGTLGATNPAAGASSLTSQFYALVKIAESPSESSENRNQALKQIEQVISSEKAPAALKEKGLAIATTIAVSTTAPATLRQTADRIIANIKKVSLAEIPAILAAEKIDRSITTVILHHVGAPFKTQSYKGVQTLLNLAKFQINDRQWSKVSWHYAIAPDGTIWLGAPLNESAIHTVGQNKTSLSVLLLLDGNLELPTAEQKTTLSALLPLLLTKFKLAPKDLVPHRFYNARNTCPGLLVSEEYMQQLTYQ